MASKASGLLGVLKANESFSYDLIKNPKGEEHYKDEYVLIDTDNILEEANSGYFEGVELTMYGVQEIKGFDKLAADKSAWTFPLPIQKLDISGFTPKQTKALLESIGEGVLDLTVDFSDALELNVNDVVNSCKNLKRLSLTGNSWDFDKLVKLDIDPQIGFKLDYLKIELQGEDNVFDFSKSSILELDLDVFDANKSKLPNNLRNLRARINGSKVNWNNLQNLEVLDLSFFETATISDLTFLRELKELKSLTIRLGGESQKFEIELPQLEYLDFHANHLKVDFSFLSTQINLKSLTLTTDVYNGGEGFYKLANIEALVNLEKLELNENGLGIDKFKSEFKSSFLLKLSNLKSLILDGIKNVKDLVDFKNLSKLEYLKIRNSKIENLNGVQSLTCLKNFELYDCHSISDLYSVSNDCIEKLSFNISSFWATEVKIKKEDLLKLDQVDIPNIEIYIEDMKFPKKDYTSLSKKYNIEAEKGSLSLDLKN